MGGLLTAADLASMRATAASALDDTCDVRRNPQAAQIGVAGNVKAPAALTDWTLAAGGVACSLTTPPQNTLGQIDSKIAQLAVWVLALPTGTDCRVGDRVRIASTGDVMTVHAALSPQTYSTLDQFVIGKVR